MKTITTAILSASMALLGNSAFGSEQVAADQARAILDATGVQGGLIVHVGCGNGNLTAALGSDTGYVVQGLDADPDNVAQARSRIESAGVYGRVSALRWDAAKLPYVDHSVNLIVAENPDQVSSDEISRVLAPAGVAYCRQASGWVKTVQPPQPGVDEWTHYLHDASGNPVADDDLVGPPRHLQWTAAPRHSRSHEFTPSIQAVVSSGGRVFYIADQGSIATLKAPSDWKLTARDAYNGILLWERPVEKWFPHIYGWTQGPRQLQCKLIAVDDHVYVTLGLFAPLAQLDAGTGETVRLFDDTEGAEEILYQDGVLLVVVREVTPQRLAAYQKWEELASQADSPLEFRDSRTPYVNAYRSVENQAARTILAIDTHSGKELWKKSGGQAQGLKPLSLRACGNHVYCEKRGEVCCFDLRSGDTIWSLRSDPLRAVSDEAVICVSRRNVMRRSPEDGAVMWTQPVTLATVRDVLLVGDSLWMGGGRPYDTGNPKHTGPNWGAYFAVEHDLATGKVVREITGENPKHHHRCYENKATNNYILGGRRGTEFLDLDSGDYLFHSWARGTCRYGVMPCNGMVYIPPHACGCYITVKLMGFNALAPARAADGEANRNDGEARLERGPAYQADASPPEGTVETGQWPTFRADAARSGRAACTVPTSLSIMWQTEGGEPITPPTAAARQVLLAQPDQHRVLALDGASGKTRWTFTAGGRVDSPPTIYQDRAIFGCRDGYTYSVRLDDGALAWRFRAARQPGLLVANEQLESPTPVHGSVLIHGGVLAFAAGRSSYLDGGLELYRLDPVTGQTLSTTDIYSPEGEDQLQPEQYGPNSMPGARNDILAADDQHIYLRDSTFGLDGTPVTERQPHLFTLTDYLDDTWPHRSYWIFGTESSISTGCSGQKRGLLYGRILVFDDKTVFGYGREKVHWSNEFEDGRYRVFARHRGADKPHWSVTAPVHIHAMLLAGDVVFAAGAGPAPGNANEDIPVSPTPLLLAYSAQDGTELARFEIPAAPVLNGIAAVDERLILALGNGQVVCMAGK